jgi:putative Ca2+/H+ antiporter (TMEM165/GDT1 family)
MSAYLNAVLLVVVGEMGDKTQLLAMAMAGKYKAGAVMLGVLLATLLNHALAVLVGSYLSSVLPLTLISIVAGVSFLVFGLWTIRGDELGEDGKKASRFGPMVTVAIAFFLAEMGDKTQLMTVTLAAEYRDPLWILAGTTTGMLIADGLGVLGGAWLCKHVSQSAMKWMAGVVFIFFGSLTIYNNAPAWLLSPFYIAPYLLLMGGLVYLVGVRLARRAPTPCEAMAIEEESQEVVLVGARK